MTAKSWRTTVVAVLGAIATNALAYFQANQKINWVVFSITMVMVAVAAFTKDSQVTGGTIPQPSNEAAKQAVLNPELKGDTNEKINPDDLGSPGL